jgi:hypothetical protein
MAIDISRRPFIFVVGGAPRLAITMAFRRLVESGRGLVVCLIQGQLRHRTARQPRRPFALKQHLP